MAADQYKARAPAMLLATCAGPGPWGMAAGRNRRESSPECAGSMRGFGNQANASAQHQAKRTQSAIAAKLSRASQ